MMMRGDLVTPIPGPNPAGIDLRYDPLYDKIKEARHEDDDAPQGEWQRARKTADFAMVTKLAGEALATRSKDLQLAAWLTEAQLRRDGFAGLRAGLEFLRALLVRYWDDLYPQLEDGDPELRAAPLSWVGLTLGPAVRSVPLNRTGHDFFKYKESRTTGYEADAASEPKKLQMRQQAIEDGKLSAEEFDRGFDATPKAWYKELAADVDGSVEALGDLDRVSRERFGDTAPNFLRLQDSLAEVQRVVRQLLAKKLELEPDPPELVAAAAPATAASQTTTGSDSPQRASAADQPFAHHEVVDRESATASAIAAARFLRSNEPRSPASYLILRGLRWGELRAHGERPDPRLLEAPSSQVRSHLKTLLLDRKWTQLLEAVEGVMATPVGRGWLDLQRYALCASEGLGDEFGPVSQAIRSELKSLLADVPELASMSLMDDMPTANPDTQQWLREQGLNGAHAPGDGRSEEQRAVMETNGQSRSSDRGWDRASAEVHAGRAERGLQLLMDELNKEKTPRARFLRRTQIARIMVDSGLEAIAVPILTELLGLIENHKLAEWEAGDLVAEPMALLYQCIERLAPEAVASDHSKDTLYPRICSLDPLQAMALKSK
jgi:type VI secretion system protein ImpA